MCTVRRSSRLLGGGLSAQGGLPDTPCEQNDRCLWKHYIAATTLRTVTKGWLLMNGEPYGSHTLHGNRDWDSGDQDGHNRKQWFPVPISV